MENLHFYNSVNNSDPIYNSLMVSVFDVFYNIYIYFIIVFNFFFTLQNHLGITTVDNLEVDLNNYVNCNDSVVVLTTHNENHVD